MVHVKYSKNRKEDNEGRYEYVLPLEGGNFLIMSCGQQEDVRMSAQIMSKDEYAAYSNRTSRSPKQ